MGNGDAAERAHDLSSEIGGNITPRDSALTRIRERHRRIEVRARDRTERQDQCDEPSAGRDCVGEESDCDVSTRESLAHDPGTNDGREEQRRSDRLGNDAPSEINLRHRSSTDRNIRRYSPSVFRR